MPLKEEDIEAQRSDTAQHVGGRAGIGPRREPVGLGPVGTARCWIWSFFLWPCELRAPCHFFQALPPP